LPDSISTGPRPLEQATRLQRRCSKECAKHRDDEADYFRDHFLLLIFHTLFLLSSFMFQDSRFRFPPSVLPLKGVSVPRYRGTETFDDSSLMLTPVGSVGAKSLARAVTSERSGNFFNSCLLAGLTSSSVWVQLLHAGLSSPSPVFFVLIFQLSTFNFQLIFLLPLRVTKISPRGCKNLA